MTIVVIVFRGADAATARSSTPPTSLSQPRPARPSSTPSDGDGPAASSSCPALAGVASTWASTWACSPLAMGLRRRLEAAREIWKERFRWLTPYYVASGPLALALTLAYEQVGIMGLLASRSRLR